MVASSSSNITFRKFAELGCVFPSLGFLQHLSSECPNPVQKEHFTPQFSVLCGIPHLAHLGQGSLRLGHTMAVWSLSLQIWHPVDTLEEDVVIG
jgi:hypothetical protein